METDDMTTPIAAGPLDRRVGDQSYVTEDGPLITGYDMDSPDGDYYCEMHYDKETGVFTVLNFGRVLIPNE